MLILFPERRGLETPTTRITSRGSGGQHTFVRSSSCDYNLSDYTRCLISISVFFMLHVLSISPASGQGGGQPAPASARTRTSLPSTPGPPPQAAGGDGRVDDRKVDGGDEDRGQDHGHGEDKGEEKPDIEQPWYYYSELETTREALDATTGMNERKSLACALTHTHTMPCGPNDRTLSLREDSKVIAGCSCQRP